MYSWSAKYLICSASLVFMLFSNLRLNAQLTHGQASASLPEFSVVSVRPSSSEGPFNYRWTDNGLNETGNTLFWLIQAAYGLPEERFIENAPSWTKEASYDVTGKVDEEDQPAFVAMPRASRGVLLRKVLTDRFGLTYHWEPRSFSEYGLVIVNPKRGSQAIVPASPEESATPRAETSLHSVDAHGMTIEQLCHNVLGTEARQLVVDQTGIGGKVSFRLHWSRVDMSASPSQGTDTQSDPDIFSALQEQLGLKLVPIRVPVQVLVVDKVQKPSAN